MNSSITQPITQQQCTAFEDDGYLIVKDVLDQDRVEALTGAVDRIWADLVAQGHGPSENLLHHDFLWRDPLFVELVDHPRIFPIICEIMGWNIYVYHHHLGVTPQEGSTDTAFDEPLKFHQDSGRVNAEIEATPRPRLSMKAVYWLTDVSELGRGNFYVVPGSHRDDNLELPPDRNPDGAIPVCAGPGDVVLFDRRLWHARSPNHSQITRKVVFFGYAYRWLRPQFDPKLPDGLLESSDPVRRQLLGGKVTETGLYNARDEDVPLKRLLEGDPLTR
jgi:ectoine hydroxylase-related dioxygenase (phytanoyl-CoA dioxygenase family)